MLAALCASAACADVWARGVANDVAAGLERIKSYRGTTEETGISDGPVVRSVIFEKPARVRIETLEPAEHAGELFLYDGSTVILWWPKALFGIRIRGVHTPTRAQIFEHIERITRDNLRAYTFSLRSEDDRVAGHRTVTWAVRPARKAPYRFMHTVWNDERTTMPLAMTFSDDTRTPWYHFAFRDLAFDEPVTPDTFAFKFPDNAVVFDWDLDAPGITLDDAQRTSNFKVMVPASLPSGHRIEKIVRSSATIPMIAIAMDHGASMLTLTESRYIATSLAPLGKTVTVGGQPAVLSFLGPFSSVTWVRDGTQLTLTSNLGFPELLAIADSVK
jgi:outer membrane lipoprotein-sorting protein